MHIHSFEITNIRAISKLGWKAPVLSGPGHSGWNVIIGDNGSGKSTLLRSIALAIMGPKNAEALRQDWGEWLSASAVEGKISFAARAHADDSWAGKGKRLSNFLPCAGIDFKRSASKVQLVPIKWTKGTPERHIWSDKKGWFAASFGPFRRFSGGDKDQEKLFFSHPRLARHLSVFGENIALTECLDWLSQLRFEELDHNIRSSELLGNIKAFVNQPGFLPHGTRFEGVNSKSVRFVDGNGTNVPVNALGDGFRSILSLTFELLREMASAWSDSSLFEKTPLGALKVKHSGVVLIDEIDAHLHPTWQRKIGFWLTRYFPKVQFIVTTHSPLVCHAAERGSIYRLPTPGSYQTAGMISGIEKERLIFGSVLDAYGTDLFGEDVSRSNSAKEKQQRLAQLNQKALKSELSDADRAERKQLQSLFPASM